MKYCQEKISKFTVLFYQGRAQVFREGGAGVGRTSGRGGTADPSIGHPCVQELIRDVADITDPPFCQISAIENHMTNF